MKTPSLKRMDTFLLKDIEDVAEWDDDVKEWLNELPTLDWLEKSPVRASIEVAEPVGPAARPSVPSLSPRAEHKQWLFRYALSQKAEGSQFYSFCDRAWVDGTMIAHCRACGQCEEIITQTWHCGVCKKCRDNRNVPCEGCGGVGEELGETLRARRSEPVVKVEELD